MTASIFINQYWCDGGKTFEIWLKAYGFTIIDNDDIDVIIIDYDSWKKTSANYKHIPIVIIISSYNVTNIKIPCNAIFKLIPIDYTIFVEHIIELLEAKKAIV